MKIESTVRGKRIHLLHDQVEEGGFREITSALAGILGMGEVAQGGTSAGWGVVDTAQALWEGKAQGPGEEKTLGPGEDRAQGPGEGAGKGFCIVAVAEKTSFFVEENL